MLHHDERTREVDFADDLGCTDRFLVRHAGCRLIEQDQLGFARQHRTDFNPLPLAMRELAHDVISTPGKMNLVQHFLHQCLGTHWRVAPTCRQPDVLPHGQSVEHVRDLCLDADAEARDFMRGRAGNGTAAKRYTTGRGRQLAGQHLEECALAGTVGSDQAAQLHLPEGEVDRVDGHHTAEAHGQALRAQQRNEICHHSASTG